MLPSWDMFKRESSPVDWCEQNYTVSPHIAEFINTISNLLFLVLPPLLMRLHLQYTNKCGRGINIMWILLIVIGLCSAYFHATLSFLGQLLDELAILWVIMAGFALWYPRWALPRRWQNEVDGRIKFRNVCTVFATISTFMGFLEPIANAFFLFFLAVPAVVLMVQQLQKEDDSRVKNLGYRVMILWFLAIGCWVCDRFFCDFWLGIGFPYLHGAWHILIFLCSYTAIVLFAYFEVKNHIPGELPILKYYPVDTWQFGIPYVIIDDSTLATHQQHNDKHISNGNGKHD